MDKATNIRHIILFKVHPYVDENTKFKAFELLQDLGKLKGVIEWNVKESLDNRKGVIIVENGLFQDMKSFEDFKASEKHKAAGEFMAGISDWWVADYIE